MEQFDKDGLRQLRIAMNKALEQVQKDFGIKELTVGNISFDNIQATIKVTAKLQSKPEDFASKAVLLGLPPDIVGRSVLLKGKSYKIEGIDLKKRKFPVIISDGSNKKYKITESMVLNNLIAI